MSVRLDVVEAVLEEELHRLLAGLSPWPRRRFNRFDRLEMQYIISMYTCTRAFGNIRIYIYIYTENPSCKCPVAISCWNLSANAGTSKAKPDGPSSLCELGPRPPPTLCCWCICPTCPKGADILRHVIYTCGMPRAVRVHFVSSDPVLLLPTLCCTASSGKIRKRRHFPVPRVDGDTGGPKLSTLAPRPYTRVYIHSCFGLRTYVCPPKRRINGRLRPISHCSACQQGQQRSAGRTCGSPRTTALTNPWYLTRLAM